MLKNEGTPSESRLYKIRQIKINKYILNIIFIVALVFLILINFVAYKELKILLGSNRLVLHTYEVIQTIDASMYSLTDMESDQRGFLVTNDRHFIKEIDTSKMNLIENLKHLSDLTKDNPSQKVRIERLLKLVDERMSYLAQVSDAKLNDNLQTHEGLTLFNQSNDLANQVKGLAAEIKAVELTLLQERNSLLNNNASFTTQIIFVGTSD